MPYSKLTFAFMYAYAEAGEDGLLMPHRCTFIQFTPMNRRYLREIIAPFASLLYIIMKSPFKLPVYFIVRMICCTSKF